MFKCTQCLSTHLSPSLVVAVVVAVVVVVVAALLVVGTNAHVCITNFVVWPQVC